MSVCGAIRGILFDFAVALIVATPLFAQSTFDLQGYVAGRWTRAEGKHDTTGVTQFGFEWTPSRYFDLHASGVARDENTGVVDAYADARAVFVNDEIQLRAGQFFLPTSRENKGELWTSPYTISFSALNTWIGEEVRPLGADLQWRHTFGTGHALTAAATAFRGNDTMGALLGWRGWQVGSRLSVYNEARPLPPLPSFQTFFADQRDDGTKPFGKDLDGNTGVSARVRYSIPQIANIQYLYLNNHGDRQLHDGEYAWATKFNLISGEIITADKYTLAAEYLRGTTGMGNDPAYVEADIWSAYILFSEKVGRTRYSGRYDRFKTTEKDFSLAENNDETGHSWTLAWLYDLTTRLRLGAELTQFNKERAAVKTDAHTYTIEGRYSF
ncbi:MAG: hypothetical protein DMF56_18775 [Acidobacteria bacterium]|nr:MAG: hypothetical protein DMF56_18775 [Acidobacteriota bacterium]